MIALTFPRNLLSLLGETTFIFHGTRHLASLAGPNSSTIELYRCSRDNPGVMDRRSFLASLAAGSWMVPGLATPASGPGERRADIVIAGAGCGGCAAALAAARLGCRVILAEETDWIGGQLTQQAVPPDEHPWIESFGATRSYRRFRTLVRRYYRRHYPLTQSAGSDIHFNPGNGGVSRLCHDPRVALAVLQALLAPFLSAGQGLLLLGRRAAAVATLV